MINSNLICAYAKAHAASSNFLLASYAEGPDRAEKLEAQAIKELAEAAALLGFTLQPITEKEAAA